MSPAEGDGMEIKMKEYYKYNQYTKQKVRHKAIFKAIESLTYNREQSCCVERNYVTKNI